MRNTVIAAGLPHTFGQQVARAIEADPGNVRWVQSMPAVEEHLMGLARPVDLIVLSPTVREADALGMAEFVKRTSPSTAILMLRDELPSPHGPSLTLPWDVVDMSRGPEALVEAVQRVAPACTTISEVRKPSFSRQDSDSPAAQEAAVEVESANVSSDVVTAFGMAVSLLSSLDRGGLMEGWPGLHDRVLGPGSIFCLNISREVAVARIAFLRAETRRDRRLARRKLKTAADEATRFLGDVCIRPESSYNLLTSLALATKGLADALLVEERTGHPPHGDRLSLPLASAQGAIGKAEALDAWPLKAVAKALVQMLETASTPR
jgi:hypothetical protein